MVHLSEIHLKNFKSFKNAKLKIPSGFTAILGPNGSGKSNIIDGICFVLGKTSAKSLRAGKFNELITYHKNKRADYAEVILFFDNKDRKIPIDSDKIGISRKVKLKGDNNYYMIWYEKKEKENEKGIEKRKKMKKSQIIDIFNRISLSGEGLNIILQGDLIRLIEMSPKERRKLIDEICGISEYDEKKEKSQRELEKAREYIEKIDIRINEVRANLEKLKKEKNDAEQYLKLNEELKTTKYILTSKKVELLKVVMEDTEKNINALKELKEKFQSNIYNINDEIINLKNKLENIINELNEKGNEEVMELHKSIKELELNIENDKKQLNHSLDDLKNSKSQLEAKKMELNETRLKIENIRKETMEKEKEIKSIKETIKNLEDERNSLKSSVERSETHINILKQQERKLSERLNEYQKELHKLRTELNNIVGEINKKSFDLKQNNETIEKLKEELNLINKCAEDTKTLYKELEDVVVELEFSKKQLQKYEGEKKELQNKRDKLYSEYAKENAKIKALKEMENFNVNSTIKSILDAKLPGVVDIVGNLGKTKNEYKTAIEIAGGGRLNHIVVKRMDDGARAIEYLKRNKLGRATFLPMDRIKGYEPKHINENGVIGRAVDLVEFNEEYRNIFNYVFGNTIVVKDLETAKNLSKKYKVRFVSLEGDVMEASGAMVGGSIRRSSNIKVEIDTSKLEKLANELKEIENKLNGADGINNKIDEITKNINLYSAKKMELKNKLQLIKENENRKIDIIKNNNKKIKEIELANKKLMDELEELNDSKEELEYKIKNLEDKIDETISTRERVLKELKSYEDSTLIKRIREVEAEIESLIRKSDELENDTKRNAVLIKEVLIPKMAETSEKIKELNEKIGMFQKNIEFYKNNIEKNVQILLDKKDRYKDLTKDLKELTEKKAMYQKQMEALNNNKKELIEKIEGIDKEINTLLIDKAKYETRLEEEEKKLYLCEKIEDVSNGIFNKISAMEISELEKYIIKLENSIKKLEPINMRAIEDYEYIEERYKELFDKRKEYEEDEKKYLQLIEEVEKRKKEVFMEVYEKVAKNYEEIYKNIGGTGKLSLENPENPFEGGLLIDASPKNKSLQSLDVMSGGEKSLTALAFLFAIQKLTPAPFYVLDEVDAALDTKNATLIGDMIKNASKESQFIVISHREQMIAKADTLYGVYMEDGLSKIVGIKL
ncbi:chromosome segregation protein SMC [Methanothermococcus okinawensis]|uniref:Chromosome partition protein Smc n=1 Tax=Methanothermococcus okinawensis (strain DSM 14208 / JCM 11175 / IH1) TaxID=647113 RepID=F8AND7_METOI|nr:chromosome segregation protein SMC [Methanothermococcus okinawensis]AEH06197.1 chromosome segregation protein SMC [Methanothermococcus okinawensis IH1]